MQLNFNGISSKILSVTGLLILILAIGTNHWRKKEVNGSRLNEGVWDDCAAEKAGKFCHLNKAERGIEDVIFYIKIRLNYL